QTVPLQLSQIPSGAWPVNSGVPLPQGRVFETANIRLLNASNQAVNTQKKVLARWHDGSIKWVLMSFVSQPSQTKYQLQYGKKIHDTESQLIASRQANGTVSVNTGALQ